MCCFNFDKPPQKFANKKLPLYPVSAIWQIQILQWGFMSHPRLLLQICIPFNSFNLSNDLWCITKIATFHLGMHPVLKPYLSMHSNLSHPSPPSTPLFRLGILTGHDKKFLPERTLSRCKPQWLQPRYNCHTLKIEKTPGCTVFR